MSFNHTQSTTELRLARLNVILITQTNTDNNNIKQEDCEYVEEKKTIRGTIDLKNITFMYIHQFAVYNGFLHKPIT